MKVNTLITAATLGASVTSAGSVAGASKMKGARAQGLFGGSLLYPKIKAQTSCVKDKTGEYGCNKVNLHGFLSQEDAASGHTATYIFNVANLEAPVNTGYYQSPAKSIDHNQYIIDGLSYQANYGSGLRIVDVSGVKADPTGSNFEEVGFFDCHPEDDAVNDVVELLGTWSVYSYFKSRYILLNSIERCIFSLRYTGRKARFWVV